MIRESDGALLVTARQALALVPMPEGKPVAPARRMGEPLGMRVCPRCH